MKSFSRILILLTILIVVAALYRIVPGRPYGFAPQIAIALFAGTMVKDRKWAFALPILSMFLSDLIYEVLYRSGVSPIQGFYEGQFTNYILFALLTFIGFAIKKISVLGVMLASLVGPTIYFLLSNSLVWLNGTGLQRPKTWEGLMMTLADGLPFYRNSLYGTLFFSALLFGIYFLLKPVLFKTKAA
ncbi:MAG: hypothetical protein KIT80_19000 [Chitinophagaceae bacterium]|nr:hypothetical protein [Chitinophagaceae bacterium]MCW5929015.1 hypothetical protein [Chitinophagaceae bacterium]